MGVVLSSNYTQQPWTATVLLGAAVHELGHVLGLNHTTESSVMNCIVPGSIMSDPRIDPITRDELSRLYGWTDQEITHENRGTDDRPALVVAGPQTFEGRPTADHLYMAWRGVNDPTLWWSSFAPWSPQRATRFRSTHGPALLATPGPNGPRSSLMMAWKGENDRRIYYAYNDLAGDYEWGEQHLAGTLRPFGTGDGPALARFDNRTVMAWKGIPGDTGIYFSVLDSAGWADQRQVPGAETSDGPCLVATPDVLYLFWKNASDHRVYYSTTARPDLGAWGSPSVVLYGKPVEGGPMRTEPIGSTHGPSAVYRGGRMLPGQGHIHLCWKGAEDDRGVYVTILDGTNVAEQIRLPARGTATGPALASWNDRLYTAWRGAGDDKRIWYSSFREKQGWPCPPTVYG